jgi:hypothetical protein
MGDEERQRTHMDKPLVFTTGAQVSLKYRSTHETRGDRDKTVVGYILADEDGILVIEEYTNFARENDHRHVLLDTSTKDVFTQTSAQTRRIGQATEVSLWAPPWESRHDTVAGGLAFRVHTRQDLHMVEEDIYKFVDPERIDGFEDWSPESNCENPGPAEIAEQNPDASYHPEFTTSI